MEDGVERYQSHDVDSTSIEKSSQENQANFVTDYVPSSPKSSNAHQISSRFSRQNQDLNVSTITKHEAMPVPTSGDDQEEEDSKARRGRGKTKSSMESLKTCSQLKVPRVPICSSLFHLLRRIWNNSIVQKVLSLLASFLVIFLVKKLLRPSLLKSFLVWMEHHPYKGLFAYLFVYPLHMVLLLPGTPLVMGAGFVFKVQYGWTIGVIFCSIVTLFGSLVGSVMCFLLARYCMRTWVRRWSKRYPLFDPIDHAVSDNGFKIMSLIYLTPVIPLGPISYMMGITQMPLISFAKAKIAALPFTVLYVYLGAATGTLMLEDLEESSGGDLGNIGDATSTGNSDGTGTKVVHKANMEEISLSPKLIITGILFSIGSITLISIKMKKELQKILNQKHEKDGDGDSITKEKSLPESSTSDLTKKNTRQRKTKALHTESDTVVDSAHRQLIV